MVINHNRCGLMLTSEQDLRTRIQNRHRNRRCCSAFFYAFQNIDEMSATNCRSFAPIPGFPRPSPSAASSTDVR